MKERTLKYYSLRDLLKEVERKNNISFQEAPYNEFFDALMESDSYYGFYEGDFDMFDPWSMIKYEEYKHTTYDAEIFKSIIDMLIKILESNDIHSPIAVSLQSI